MKLREDAARAARIHNGRAEAVRIVRTAHQTHAGAETTPQRFQRLVRETDAARGPNTFIGKLSLWKRGPG